MGTREMVLRQLNRQVGQALVVGALGGGLLVLFAQWLLSSSFSPPIPNVATTETSYIPIWLRLLQKRPSELGPHPAVKLLQKFPRTANAGTAEADGPRRVVVLAYSEMRSIDKSNLEFFIRVAIRGNTPGMLDPKHKVDYIIAVNGFKCTPCETTLPRVLALSDRPDGWVKVLGRDDAGMDFGGHAHALAWIKNHRRNEYKYFIFGNLGYRGPFMPAWTPPWYHFTDTLVQPMEQDTELRMVAPYMSCVPPDRWCPECTPGPVLETQFFALDEVSLEWAMAAGVFKAYKTKRDTTIKCEHNLTKVVMSKGGRLESFLTRYQKGIDWSDAVHKHCNDNRMASRRGSLSGGVTVSVFEVLWVKVTWCVRSKEVAELTKWLVRLAAGEAGTAGTFDFPGFRFGAEPHG